MPSRRLTMRATACAALTVACVTLSFAQTYPARRIRLIIDFPTGGPSVRHSTPEEFLGFVRAEFDRWGPVIKQAGVRVGD